VATPLLVVGAGGFARETAAAVHELDDLDLLGFLDDDPALHGSSVGGTPVLGPIESVTDHPDSQVVVCVGSPLRYHTRRLVVDRLSLPAERYATIVHPAATVGGGTTIGAGTVILAGVVTTTAVRIGAHVAVMPSVTLTHDDVVGSYVTFGSGVRLGGSTIVEDGAYLGAGALVREACTIGRGSLIGMGSVVLGDVPAGEVWAGAPARFLRPAPEPVLAALEATP
jgi:sugar O-acyltransferase (sialic acid O-acetyltransferase NeuD family)